MKTVKAARLLGLNRESALKKIHEHPNGAQTIAWARQLLDHEEGGEELVLAVIKEIAQMLGRVPKSDAEIIEFLRRPAPEYDDVVKRQAAVAAKGSPPMAG